VIEEGIPGLADGLRCRILLAAFVLSLNFNFVFAQETCESRAVSREGKPLAGAARRAS
jgi:hypothetical protein